VLLLAGTESSLATWRPSVRQLHCQHVCLNCVPHWPVLCPSRRVLAGRRYRLAPATAGIDIGGSAAAVAEPGTAGLTPLALRLGRGCARRGSGSVLRAGVVPRALDGLAEDGRGGGEVQADEPDAAVAEHGSGSC
jgi:hypothetical protein